MKYKKLLTVAFLLSAVSIGISASGSSGNFHCEDGPRQKCSLFTSEAGTQLWHCETSQYPWDNCWNP